MTGTAVSDDEAGPIGSRLERESPLPPPHPSQGLRADPRRLARDLDRLGAIGVSERGVTRLAYSPLERRAHALFGEVMGGLGCEVVTDAAGNTIATRPGAADGAAVGTGSHLDSVYSGGRFDGIAGVVAAMEVARLLDEERVETAGPLRFVAFAGEEGARFGQACIGSKLAAGLSSLDELRDRHDVDGISIADAMAEIGIDPARAAAMPWDPADWGAFVELHVEQGTVLERTGTSVGVVDLISGSTRLECSLDGQASHTGGTPMINRADALAAAADGVLMAESLALDARHRGTRATIGRLTVQPGSITTIPGHVTFALDVRDVDSDRQRQTTAEFVRRLETSSRARGVDLSVRLLADTSPVVLPTWVRSEIVRAAAARGTSYRVLTSGASHDAQMVNRIVPTGMIFVPSRAGLSHVPEEWTSPRHLAVGVNLLCEAMTRLDEHVARSAPGAADASRDSDVRT